MAPALFRFPNPVNEKAARVVASGVVALCATALGFGQGWLLVPLAYGFWARVASGPTLSPLGQLAVRVVGPRLGPAKFVPGPPKRFAQAMGAAMSSSALLLWYGAGAHTAALVVVAMLGGAAFLEAAFALCLGCVIFGQLTRIGLIPASLCADCADLTQRHPSLVS